LTYGTLASAAAIMDSPDTVQLKSPDQYRYVGTSVERADIPAKVFANSDYAIDAEVPDMQYAAVVSSGVFGAQVESISNTEEVKTRRGVSDVFIVPDGVAAVADNPWRAEQAVRAVSFVTEGHDNSTLSTQSLIDEQRAALADKLVSGKSVGSPDDINGAIKAEYLVPYLAHATLEPMMVLAGVWHSP